MFENQYIVRRIHSEIKEECPVYGESPFDALNNFNNWLKENHYWKITGASELKNGNWHITVEGISEKSWGYAFYEMTVPLKE